MAVCRPLRERCPIEATQPRTFIIHAGDEPFQVQGRMQAIDEAKKISRRTWRQVRIERADHRVQMQFRRGSLLTYRYESRGR